MRIPEIPPDVTEYLKGHTDEFLKAHADPKLQEVLRKCEYDYWPWYELRFRVSSSGYSPEIVWTFAKFLRNSHYKILPLAGHKQTSLRFNIPDALQRELMLIDQQLAGGLTSDDDAAPSSAQKERFIISALREEAIASSMLEGAITTRVEAKQMLKTGRRPRTRGEQMVMNNYRAIQFIRENRNIDISPTFILELQKILTEDTLDHPEQVGRFRTENDTISVVDDRDDEVMHVPPPASELPKRLKALCDFANRPPHGKDFVHPVIAACVLHFQLGFDHPFCDGNGRTARALFYWMMLRCGYWLFEYLPISRLIYRAPAKYARAFLFCETDDFDVTYFLMYKARIIAMARRDLKEYISEKQSQIAQARRLLSSDGRLNHRQQEIVLHATRNQDRYFTISEHQTKYGIAYGTARADFLQLAAWKYLKKVTVGKRFEFTADEKVSGLDKRPVIKDPQLFPDAPRVIHSK